MIGGISWKKEKEIFNFLFNNKQKLNNDFGKQISIKR